VNAGPGYTVTRVPIERTFALRKAVLRPYLTADEPYSCPDDHLPETVALAALTAADEVIGVARMTPEAPPFDTDRPHSWRLRGMAARSEVRNSGVGSALLAGLIAHVADSGGGILWCNARVAARGLYERGGLAQWGEVWEEPHIGPHMVMWRNIL
jgi:GNAT superfamily N-acetyltransferase